MQCVYNLYYSVYNNNTPVQEVCKCCYIINVAISRINAFHHYCIWSRLLLFMVCGFVKIYLCFINEIGSTGVMSKKPVFIILC